MSSDEATDAGPELRAEPKRKGKLWLLAAIVVAALGGAGAWRLGLLPFPAEGDETSAESHPAPVYFTLDENLVVNFRGASGGVRYLQVGIELTTLDATAVAALKLHAPVLRNNLIMLLSDQSQEDLTDREGKEALRRAALEESRSTMEKLHGSAVIDSLYFTTFVMQ